MRHITPQQNAKMRLRTRLLAAVLAVGGAMQTVYALECIRLSKRTGDA